MALKLFNFRCVNGHTFEGMVASVEDFEKQKKAGLFCCPICDSPEVERTLSAPHVKKSSQVKGDKKQLVEKIIRDAVNEISEVIKNAEDVGDQFADEARKIHSGEKPERTIKGTATTEEVEDLLDEGIAVLPIAPNKPRTIN